MYVKWRKRSVRPTHWQEEGDTAWSATLVDAKRIDGKVKQQHVTHLGSFKEGKLKYLGWRADFWSKAKACLDQLGDRITRTERMSIEAALAEKVKPLSKAERKEHERVKAETRAAMFGLLH